MVLKFKELPVDIQLLLKTGYGFNKREVKVEAVIDFVCPTNWHDYNIQRLIGYNQLTGAHQVMTSGSYECHMNWSEAEKAMYLGKIGTRLEGPHMWFFLIETYPAGCKVYCHPDAISKLIPEPIKLTRRQQLVLFISRAYGPSSRPRACSDFKLSLSEYNTTKAELYNLGLMHNNGSLTTAGKNAVSNIHSWPYGDNGKEA